MPQRFILFLRYLFGVPRIWQLGLGGCLILSAWAFVSVAESILSAVLWWVVLWVGIFWMMFRGVMED